MKRILATLAVGVLLMGTGSMAAQAHGPGGHPGGGGEHRPIPGGGGDHHPFPGGGGERPPSHGGDHGPGGDHHPFPGGNHGPDRWHGPEHSWGGGWDRHVYRGAWFWYSSSVVLLWVDSGYVQTPVFYDDATGLYYWVDDFGQAHWLN